MAPMGVWRVRFKPQPNGYLALQQLHRERSLMQRISRDSIIPGGEFHNPR
jgi:hypothetical protein